MSIGLFFLTSALGIVTPWGQDSRSEAWLQELRGRAAGAHGWPCNIARLTLVGNAHKKWRDSLPAELG